jgi:hypothetical protein
MKMNMDTKTRQWDQFLGILPSKEGLLDFGACSLCVLVAYSIALAPIVLIMWVTGNL